MTFPSASRLCLGLLGLTAALAVGETLARLHGDRLCTSILGAVYQSDPRFGWGHVPGLAGWVGGCPGSALPSAAVDIDRHGLRDFDRPYDKPAGTARVLLLGGNLPEGFGVPDPATVARVLEGFADARRGAPLEVINAGVGGFALDNALLYFRAEGVRFAPDVVVLVLEPSTDVTALSPVLLRQAGQKVPAKPYFTLVDGKLVATPLAVAPGTEAPAPDTSPLARLQLYRTAYRVPTRTGPPFGWTQAELPGAVADDPLAERNRTLDVAHALLAALRDETAAVGGHLLVVVAPSRPGARRYKDEGALALLDLVASVDVPAVNLHPVFTHYTLTTGRAGYLPGTVRWDRDGHFLVASMIWNALEQQHLLPAGLVRVRSAGGGRVAPLRPFPGAILADLWRARHGLFAHLLGYGLLGVCLVWAGAPLPPAARDWVLVAVSAGMVWALGARWMAEGVLALAVCCYGAIELLPPRLARAFVGVLLATLVGAATVGAARWLPADAPDARLYLAVAAGFSLLRLASYAHDRLGGHAGRRPLREFLAAMLFFPTFFGGPLASVEAWAAGRVADGTAPSAAAALRAGGAGLARIAWGTTQLYVATRCLGALTPDVYATAGAALGRARLWVWVGEQALVVHLVLAGWTAVAAGLGALVGVRVTDNFRAPWRAADVADFWRRWYASFTDWLRAHVYRPLGGRGREPGAVVAVFAVSTAWCIWLWLTAVGPTHYRPAALAGVVLWGALHAAGVLAAHRRPAGVTASAVEGALLRAGTFLLVALAWVPFFLPPWKSVGDALAIWMRLVVPR